MFLKIDARSWSRISFGAGASAESESPAIIRWASDSDATPVSTRFRSMARIEAASSLGPMELTMCMIKSDFVMLRRETGRDDVVDLARYAAQRVCKLITLDLRDAVFIIEHL